MNAFVYLVGCAFCLSFSLKLVLMSILCAASASATVLGSPADPALFLGLDNAPCIDALPLSVAETDPCEANEGAAECPLVGRLSDGCLVIDDTGRSVDNVKKYVKLVKY